MATLGYNTIGGTGGGAVADQFEVSGPWTMSENGTATQAQFNGSSATSAPVTFGIYNDSGGVPGTLVSVSAQLIVGGLANSWQSIALAGSLLSGQAYWICAHFGGTVIINFDSGTPTGRFKVGETYSGGSLPDPAPTTTAFSSILRSLYIDYTPTGGGGGGSPILMGQACL